MEAGDGLDALERDRDIGSERRETLPDVGDPWGCRTVAPSFGQGLSAGNFAGTVQDQHSAMAASEESEAQPTTSAETIVWNRQYFLETVRYEGATGELAVVNAVPGWKMGMVAAGSEQPGSDVAKEASSRSAPMSEL